jgi:hypothetical protein
MVFWDVTSWISIDSYQSFGGTVSIFRVEKWHLKWGDVWDQGYEWTRGNTDGPSKGCFVNAENRMKHTRKDGGEARLKIVDACLTCIILLPFIIILYVIMQPSVYEYSLYSVIVPLLCETSIHWINIRFTIFPIWWFYYLFMSLFIRQHRVISQCNST